MKLRGHVKESKLTLNKGIERKGKAGYRKMISKKKIYIKKMRGREKP